MLKGTSDFSNAECYKNKTNANTRTIMISCPCTVTSDRRKCNSDAMVAKQAQSKIFPS